MFFVAGIVAQKALINIAPALLFRLSPHGLRSMQNVFGHYRRRLKDLPCSAHLIRMMRGIKKWSTLRDRGIHIVTSICATLGYAEGLTPKETLLFEPWTSVNFFIVSFKVEYTIFQ